MAINPLTMQFLNNGRTEPVAVIDGGPAKCEALDRGYLVSLSGILPGREMEVVKANAAGTGAPRGSEFEADWVATSEGLHYVHFYMGGATVAPWDSVVGASIAKRSIFAPTATVRVEFTENEAWLLQVGKRAAASLVSVVGSRCGVPGI